MSESAKRAVILSLAGIFVFFVLTSLSPATANAHAPQKVLLAYDGATKTMKITITHTRFSEDHYINKVEIKQNGRVITVREYQGQPSETFTYPFKIAAVSGDTFAVEASCSKFGSTSAAITIGKEPSKTS
jgi:hypothetical protein